MLPGQATLSPLAGLLVLEMHFIKVHFWEFTGDNEIQIIADSYWHAMNFNRILVTFKWLALSTRFTVTGNLPAILAYLPAITAGNAKIDNIPVTR